ncbi:MAG: DUF3368 domain-containing protein [Caldilineales bacterium]|nr:DUF3368 domain-containing protein [Caldilineales bacterium]
MNSLFRVVNTAPLIFLSKLNHLELLRQGCESVFVPPMVLKELRAAPDDATAAVELALQEWLIERQCEDSAQVSVISQVLDAGEAEVIALELGTTDVVLDDLDARRFARRNGLFPIGTLGLLLAAKRNNLIPAIRSEIEALAQAGFRATESLVAQILSAADE